MKKKMAIPVLFMLLGCMALKAQNVALKTNLLYAATGTPNLGAEISVGHKHTAQLFYGLNPWKSASGHSLRHWVLQPEYRYWFCESFSGWFVGVHLMGGQFNASRVDMPFGILNGLKANRYEGWFAGGGLTAGYQWMLSRHWNVETSVGVGYNYIQYKKYGCERCGEKKKDSHTHYVGPTKAALSMIYVF